MAIRVVTDSTSDLPEETAASYGITVIPAYVNIGENSYLDVIELSRHDFYEKLPTYRSLPTTAAPAPGAFTETYDKLAAEGATEILSIHVATSLSGLLNSARIGAEAADSIAVTLFDSQQLSMGLGLLAIAATALAGDDRPMDEIVAILQNKVARTHVFAVLDTLEYLRRSGRVNWAEFGLGSLLRIKPLIKVHMGEVDILERIRSSGRALNRMLERVAELGPLESVALLHTHAFDKLETFAQQAQFLMPENLTPLAVEVTPAIGSHVGPGALGIACIAAAKGEGLRAT
jgi:DegV family protein with EDD domain